MISVITKNDKLLKENNEITIKNEKLKKKISFLKVTQSKQGLNKFSDLITIDNFTPLIDFDFYMVCNIECIEGDVI